MTQIIEFFVSFMNDLWYTVFDSVSFEIDDEHVPLGVSIFASFSSSFFISFLC